MWIEIYKQILLSYKTHVTPYAGVWIEILRITKAKRNLVSLPMRECGLKFVRRLGLHMQEIVTPYAGVWIEINVSFTDIPYTPSLPMRECGLKL